MGQILSKVTQGGEVISKMMNPLSKLPGHDQSELVASVVCVFAAFCCRSEVGAVTLTCGIILDLPGFVPYSHQAQQKH